MIEWDSLIVEMVILAVIIFFSVYLEHWAYRRLEKQKENKEQINGSMALLQTELK